MKNSVLIKIIVLAIFDIGVFLLLLSPSDSYAGTYDGSPDWHAPKKAICAGIPEFPNGIEVLTYADQVFGKSFDRYIFSQMGGAMGIYYFDMELQSPSNSGTIEGTATYFDSLKNWKHTEFRVNCTVTEWHTNRDLCALSPD